MLKLQNISITRGSNLLIDNIDLVAFEKNVIGLIGSNGCGKTSLFAAILGQLEPSHGEVQLKKGTKIVSIEQEVPAVEASALSYTISGDTKLFSVLQKLEHAESVNDYAVIMDCHTRLHEIDGYSAEAKAAKILHGLGFSQQEMQQSVKQFSGGWRMRLNLAKCLYTPSDLLLLDEPTNHLDMETIIWLENYLRNYPGAVIMVSHDQDFLDNTVTHIAHIENQHLKLYTGNYSSFEIQHSQAIALQNAQYRKQQTQINHMMKFVARFSASASKAKQAQSRLKAIEKMELVQPVFDKSPFKFEFMQPGRMPDPMLTLKKVELGYDTKVILRNINLNLMAGQRVGLLGINGAGKSTLIKCICGELKPLQGMVERPSKLVIGYFAQHQVDHLDLEGTALSQLRDIAEGEGEKRLISYLGSFGFSRDQSLSPLKQFSGGEKARVALALMIWQRPNLLLLDEPTNHLDLEMRQALTMALQNYQGALVLVSHDRHLMRTLVDELYLIDKGQLSSYDGSVESYQQMVLGRES